MNPADEPAPAPDPDASPEVATSNRFHAPELLKREFDQYQRYRGVCEVILDVLGEAELRKAPIRLLDVGSNVLNLFPEFLQGDVAQVVRCDFLAPEAAGIDLDDASYVQLEAGQPLPFEDDAFDVVVALDVLEHMPLVDRDRFVADCGRVAGKLVVLTAPRGSVDADVEAAEDLANNLYRRYFGKNHEFLREHRAFGLPTAEAIHQSARRAGLDCRSVQNSYLPTWVGMMLLGNRLFAASAPNSLFEEFNTFFNRRYYRDTFARPGYRQIYAIADEAILAKLGDGWEASLCRDRASEVRMGGALEPLSAVLEVFTDFVNLEGGVSVQRRELLIAREQEIETLRAGLRAEQHATSTAQEAVRDVQRARAGEQASVRKLEAKVQERDAAFDTLLHHSAQQESSLQGMRGSMSWRATRWLRGAVDVAGKARRVAARRLPKRSPVAQRVSRILENKTAGSYSDWVRQNSPDGAALEAMRHAVADFESKPCISLLVPVYDVDAAWLRRCIASVEGQVYPYWELCLVDDCSTKPHIREILDEASARDPRIRVCYRAQNGGIVAASNDALHMAQGGFVGLLDNDDELAPHALFVVVRELAKDPNIAFVYTDEDKLDADGNRTSPAFKPAFDPAYFRSTHYPCHFTVYHRDAALAVGGFRPGFDGSQDFDLALRVFDHVGADAVRHVPEMVYHWRMIPGSAAVDQMAKPDAHDAARRALVDHLERRGQIAPGADPKSRVEQSVLLGLWRVRPSLPDPLPLVSLVIPTAGWEGTVRGERVDLVVHTVQSVVEKSSYPELEVIVVLNGRLRESTAKALEELGARIPLRIVEVDYPFNFSRKVNDGVAAAAGDYVVLLNDDTEVISEDWVESMLEVEQQDEIGVVGSRLLFEDGRIQHNGIVVLSGVPHHAYIGYPDHSDGTYGMLHQIRGYTAVTGACMLVAKSTWDAIGGFDPELALNYNDVDFCLRARALGYLAAVTPFARLFHFEGVTKDPRGLDVELARFHEKWPELTESTWRDPTYSPHLDQALPFFELPGVHASPNRAPLPLVGSQAGSHAVVADYAVWRQHRILERARNWPARVEPGLFSVITAVWETTPAHLRELAQSVFRQTWTDFEWILADNGTKQPKTLAVLRDLENDPRVKVVRLSTNEGICAGMHRAFLETTGRYVVCVDHDDLLTPDALAVLGSAIQQATGDGGEGPPLLYSDEDKCFDDGTIHSPFFKPDWDPVLFTNCCYIAHLIAFDRRLADLLGCWTDKQADGSPDYDAFLRFVAAGHAPLHVPELLYSWRMHRGSTASGKRGVKEWAVENQRHALSRLLGAHARGRDFVIEPNPLDDHPGNWRLRRIAERLPAVCLAVLPEFPKVGDLRAAVAGIAAHTEHSRLQVCVGASSDVTSLDGVVEVIQAAGDLPLDVLRRAAEAAAALGGLVATVAEGARPQTKDWLVELSGLIEFHPELVGACGTLVDSASRVVADGGVFGFGRALYGSPQAGRQADEGGYYSLGTRQRRTSVAPLGCALYEPEFVLEAIAAASLLDTSSGDQPADLASLGAWLAVHAATSGRFLAVSPHARCVVRGPGAAGSRGPTRPSNALDRGAWTKLERSGFADACHPESFGLSRATAARQVWPQTRRAELVELGARFAVGSDGGCANLKQLPKTPAEPTHGVESGLQEPSVALPRPRDHGAPEGAPPAPGVDEGGSPSTAQSGLAGAPRSSASKGV